VIEQTKALGGPAAFDEVNYEQYDRDEEKQVNQRAGDVEYDEARDPNKDEHDREKN
jgi:hypothetical protein